MRAAAEVELRAQNALDAARDAAIAAQWEHHNLILGARNRGIALFGAVSDEVASLDMKKRSERKAPTRNSKASKLIAACRATAHRQARKGHGASSPPQRSRPPAVGPSRGMRAEGVAAAAVTHFGSMSFPVETRLTCRARLGSPRTEGRGVVSVEGAVKGGRSPAKRTRYSQRTANTLKGSGLAAAVCGQLASPAGGKDFPALRRGARGRGARWARREGLWSRGGSTRNGGNPAFRGNFSQAANAPSSCSIKLNLPGSRDDARFIGGQRPL
ncbi:MAG: hypothetical protein AW08_02826 [Candidatus Accumulibacter adjunctus]|uniref:Uncharacterized protein n=1 Tax=Candidatus Accumulibacter adjunctus TaxID=1454001 RepID=A0A011MT92_9PROT|nr:MAG: hypothetical protein AW08_02826 [Candidatus Accumulibacter adjunctus]